jgi:chromosome partitioning protein
LALKIIVFASRKGGTGKTTLTGHVAVAVEAAGHGPVVLMDGDPQGSLADWWDAREAMTPAFAACASAELAASCAQLAADGAAWCLIDTPPAAGDATRAAIAVADLVIIPVRPSPHDLRAIGATIDMCRDAGRPFVFVVTQAKPLTAITAQIVAALSEHGQVAPILIGDRVAYASAMADGRTVTELDPRGKPAAEVDALTLFVFSLFTEKRKSRKD